MKPFTPTFRLLKSSQVRYFLLLCLMMIGVAPSVSYARIETMKQEKTYTFHFNWHQLHFEAKKSAETYEEAFEHAAQECFRHFKSSRKISFEEGQDIIDSCANPQS